MSFISLMLPTRMVEELTAYSVMFMCANVISSAVRVTITARMVATGMRVHLVLKRFLWIISEHKQNWDTKLSWQTTNGLVDSNPELLIVRLLRQ
jgi:hypothetical protein